MAVGKLNPPIIEGTLPAFYSDGEGKGATLVVPFALNKAVSQSDIQGFAVKIKTVQSNTFILSLSSNEGIANGSAFVEGAARFYISEEQLKVLDIGRFYKVQMAFGGSWSETNQLTEVVGYYSTVGIVKYTAKPEVIIDGLETDNLINMHNYYYIGRFTASPDDITERVYSYNFTVWDADNQVIATTGEIVHSSDNDISSSETIDEFSLPQDLKVNHSYYIQYTITTLNKMVVESPKYRIMQKNSIDPELQAKLIAELNYDNGYANITLEGEVDAETGLEIAATGAFVLCRSSDQEDYNVWHEVLRFNLQGQLPSRWLWKDCTIEQGVSYVYSLQQYNDANIYSNRQLSNILYADFEDSFLYDGDRQLKIRFNPKVSSFKKNILETKIDTLGGKHPFIFRNGIVEYREFPISGLISYQMDEEEMFMDRDKLYNIKTTTNLTSDNLTAERLFKMEVLEWLTNGQPKLFRSPTEGSFIVRLMNSSLTPSDQVGRMLHTFSSTAYEIADYTFDNLASYGFLNTTDPTTIQRRWETIEFKDFSAQDGYYYEEFTSYQKYNELTHTSDTIILASGDTLPEGVYYVYNTETKLYETYHNIVYPSDGTKIYTRFSGWKQVNNYPAQSLHFIDMLPGDQFRVDGKVFVVGVTGGYYLDLGYAIKIVEINTATHQGSLTYGYDSKSQNVFDSVTDIDIVDIPAHQFFGEWDILNEIENVKEEIQNLYQLHSIVRPVQIAYFNNGNLYYDAQYQNPIELSLLYVYKIVAPNKPINGYYLAPRIYNDLKVQLPNTGSLLQGAPLYTESQFNYYLQINGSLIDLSDIREYSLKDTDYITEIIQGPGLMTDITYQKSIIEYSIEDKDVLISSQKNSYLAYQKRIDDAMAILHNDDYDVSIETYVNAQDIIDETLIYRNNTYYNFLKALEAGLEEIKRAKSIT